MKIINEGSGCPLVRVDYSCEAPWHQLLTYFCLANNDEDYDENRFYPEFLVYEGKGFNGISIQEIIKLMTEPKAAALFLFDNQSVVDNTLVCIDLLCIDTDGNQLRTFRVIREEAAAVENNLSLINMVFTDFYESCDINGVFRGFPGES